MENPDPIPDSVASPATAENGTPQSHKPWLLIFLLIVLVLISLSAAAYLFHQNNQLKKQIAQLPQTKITPVMPSLSSTQDSDVNNKLRELETSIKFSSYQKVDSDQLFKNSDGSLTYGFKSGIAPRPYHGNYDLTFPNTWELFFFENDKNRDDHGTNLILRKDSDFVRIKQQLYESGSCVFDKKDVANMSYLCNLVQPLPNPKSNFKIFTLTETEKKENSFVRFGVCNQNNYAESVSTYTTPTEKDRRVCSPWTDFGEIEFFTLSNNAVNFNEFIEIVKNLQLQPF